MKFKFITSEMVHNILDCVCWQKSFSPPRGFDLGSSITECHEVNWELHGQNATAWPVKNMSPTSKYSWCTPVAAPPNTCFHEFQVVVVACDSPLKTFFWKHFQGDFGLGEERELNRFFILHDLGIHSISLSFYNKKVLCRHALYIGTTLAPFRKIWESYFF